MTVKTASQLISEAAPSELTKTAGAWADVYDSLMANRYANTGNGDVVSGGKVGKGWHHTVSPCFEAE